MANSTRVAESKTAARTPTRGAPVTRSVIRPLMAKVTVTLNVPLAVFPEVSVAVQLTVVVPWAKALPEAGVQTADAIPTLSVAVGAKVTTAVDDPGGALTVMSAGIVSAGGSLSRTVMLNEVFVVPFTFVAVHVAFVRPTPRVAGEVGAHATVLDSPVNRTFAVGRPGDVVVVTSARGPRRTGRAVLGTQSRAARIASTRRPSSAASPVSPETRPPSSVVWLQAACT